MKKISYAELVKMKILFSAIISRILNLSFIAVMITTKKMIILTISISIILSTRTLPIIWQEQPMKLYTIAMNWIFMYGE